MCAFCQSLPAVHALALAQNVCKLSLYCLVVTASRWACCCVSPAGVPHAVHVVTQDVVDPDLRRVIPYLLLISLIGNFIMIQLRKRFIVDYRLPYPSSTVAGIVLNSLHVKGSQKRAVRQARWPLLSLSPTYSLCMRCLCQQCPSTGLLPLGRKWYLCCLCDEACGVTAAHLLRRSRQSGMSASCPSAGRACAGCSVAPACRTAAALS